MFQKLKEYFSSRKDKRIEKAGKLIKNAKAIREDRWAALEYLAEGVKEAELAIPNLLPRFEYSLEHGINDTREKELALQGISRFGEAAVPFVRSWLQHTTRIAWPIKVLKELGKDEDVVACLKAALNYNDVSFDQAAVDKNYDVLCYLREYQVGEALDQLVHFLHDPDERVRYAAAELLISQQKSETIKGSLEPFLKDESSENRRIRQAVIQAFLENKWKISQPELFPNGQIVPGLVVDGQGVLQVRT